MDWSRGHVVPAPQPAAVSIRKLLGYRQSWAFILGKFLTDPVWWFFLFWLPQYFNTRFQLNLSHMGLPLVAVYLASTVGSVGGGWLPRAFTSAGLSLKRARMAAMAVCACLVVPVSMAGGVESMWLAVAFVSLAAAAHQGWSANIFTTSSDMFPAECVGTVVSFGQVAGAVGGALFQPIAGNILTLTHSYVPLFLYSGFAYLLALLLVHLLAPGLRRAHLED
jgi:ACS family hexuronate transporter-like MFS transporter